MKRNYKTTIVTSADFEASQVDFVPLSLRDIKLQKSDVAWSDIGGLSSFIIVFVLDV
jgi:SpoVK/Ycf46/Vps4 family AAA+-type ATPase